MQPVHDTFAHIGIVFNKILDSWLNNSVSPTLEDGFNSTDTNDINNEKPTTRSLPTHGSALIIRMEGSNETAGMAAPPPEIVSTETPVNSTSVRIEVNNVPTTSVDLGIGDASARQDSMSIAREAHEETTARQDSMSAGIVSQEDATARQDSMSIARKAHNGETAARQDSMSIAGIVSQEDATARQDSMSITRKAHNGETTARRDSMSIAGTVNENHLALMTDALTGQRYALHDERQETCNVPVNDPLRRTVNNITQRQPVDPMGYANMGYRKAVITIAPFPIWLSMASEGDICLFHSTLHVKEKTKLIQLPTVQASTLQVHVYRTKWLSLEFDWQINSIVGTFEYPTMQLQFDRIFRYTFARESTYIVQYRGSMPRFDTYVSIPKSSCQRLDVNGQMPKPQSSGLYTRDFTVQSKNRRTFISNANLLVYRVTISSSKWYY